jgi:hypothetical protein
VHTAEEAAAILRVRPSWLERQAAARKIPFALLGGSYRFTAAHLAEIVRIHEHIPADRPGRADYEPSPRPLRLTGNSDVAPLRPRPRVGPRRAA